jgi:HEPN domain-containing protein
MPQIHQSGKNASLALTWLGWADNDYVAARSLLLRNLLTQGAALSNTAVEKYLKSLRALQSLPTTRSHNVSSLYENLKKAGMDLGLNAQYLALLVKAYRLRYPDDLEVGFNIVLAQTKMLVELDATVHRIRKGFVLQKAGKRIVTRLDSFRQANDPRLTDRNCYFGHQLTDRAQVFQGDCGCHEIRIIADHLILEATYLTNGIADDGVFDREGLKPGNGSGSGPSQPS